MKDKKILVRVEARWNFVGGEEWYVASQVSQCPTSLRNEKSYTDVDRDRFMGFFNR